MEVYNSEQDQVEAIKAWWEKYGKLVIVGVIALLLSVFGWRTWQDRQYTQAESASLAYFQMHELAATDPGAAMEIGRHIVGEFSSTTYAPMAGLLLARLSVEQGDWQAAEAHLRSVLNQTRMPEIQWLARLRLAQVLFAQGNYSAALTELGQPAGLLQAAYDELRGDVYAAQGETQRAITAYRAALDGFVGQPDRSMLIEMKLADLAGIEGA